MLDHRPQDDPSSEIRSLQRAYDCGERTERPGVAENESEEREVRQGTDATLACSERTERRLGGSLPLRLRSGAAMEADDGDRMTVNGT